MLGIINKSVLYKQEKLYIDQASIERIDNMIKEYYLMSQGLEEIDETIPVKISFESIPNTQYEISFKDYKKIIKNNYLVIVSYSEILSYLGNKRYHINGIEL